MKLPLDQGLPRSTVSHLASYGIAAEHIADLGMVAVPDEEILVTARQHQAVIVTLDADFHQLLAASHETSPSVVRIRMEGLKGERLAAILNKVIRAAATELGAGAVVSVTPSRIRVRSLPIGR